MTDNNKSAFENSLDIMFSESAKKAAANIAKELQTDEDHIFSPEHEEKMRILFKKERRSQRKHTILKYTRTVACIFVMCILIAASIVTSVSAWRQKFINYFFNATAPNTDFSLSGKAYQDEYITLSYLPEGFSLTENKSSPGDILITFGKEDKYFNITVSSSDTSYNLDTENGTVQKTAVNNCEAVYIQTPRIHAVLWHDNEMVYVITGNISHSEIMLTAEGLKLNK